MAVGPDADLLALDERGGRRLELDLLALDAVRGQLPADAEKTARGLHSNLLGLDRRNLRCAAQIDCDFLGLQPAVDANGSAGLKFLGGDSALDGQRTTRGNLLGLDGAVDLERAARLDLFGLQTPGDSRRARRPEFLHMHIGLEDAGPGDARGLGLQRTLDPRTPRRLELDRLDRVPAHDAAAEDLDRLLAQLRPDSREIDRTHRFANDVTRMLRMAARLGLLAGPLRLRRVLVYSGAQPRLLQPDLLVSEHAESMGPGLFMQASRIIMIPSAAVPTSSPSGETTFDAKRKNVEVG